jgi:hypothetical protein
VGGGGGGCDTSAAAKRSIPAPHRQTPPAEAAGPDIAVPWITFARGPTGALLLLRAQGPLVPPRPLLHPHQQGCGESSPHHPVAHARR